MALIKCSECGKEISDKANTCPNCGNPIEKRKVKTTIERISAFFGSAIQGSVSIDNMVVGKIKNGQVIEIELPVGTHYVSVSSDVNTSGNIFRPGTNKTDVDGKQFEITDDTTSVYITVKSKGSWQGNTGSLVINEIIVK